MLLSEIVNQVRGSVIQSHVENRATRQNTTDRLADSLDRRDRQSITDKQPNKVAGRVGQIGKQPTDANNTHTARVDPRLGVVMRVAAVLGAVA